MSVHKQELLDLAQELMESEGLPFDQALAKADALYGELQDYAEAWDRDAARAQRAHRLYELWYGNARISAR